VTWFVHHYIHFVNNTECHINSVFKLQEQTISNQFAHCTQIRKQKAQKVAKKTRTFLPSLQPFAPFASLYRANGIYGGLQLRVREG
jgi:hypothetical protein